MFLPLLRRSIQNSSDEGISGGRIDEAAAKRQGKPNRTSCRCEAGFQVICVRLGDGKYDS